MTISHLRSATLLVATFLLVGCGAPLTPEFTMNRKSGKAPLTVEFTNLTEGADANQWSFGDGSESTEESPSHTYTKAGVHTVTLRVSEGGETPDTTSATKEVRVEPGPLSKVVVDNSELKLSPQEVHTFEVEAVDEFGNAIPHFEVTSRSIEPAGRTDGQSTFTAGTKPGEYSSAVTVEATADGTSKSVSVDVSIHPGPPDRVAVTPSEVILDVGEQQRFEAVALDAFDNQIDDAEVTWEANAAGRIDTEGHFTAGSKSGVFRDAIKATAANDDQQALGAATVGIRLTIGPYTWPPEKNADNPASYQPKYRLCWAALRATPSPAFSNPYDSIGHGPVEVAYLRNLTAAGHKLNHDDWVGHVETVIAGATARVTLYPEENFGGEPHVLDPGDEFKLGESSLEQVASLKIEYVP